MPVLEILQLREELVEYKIIYSTIVDYFDVHIANASLLL